ncbi:hypothetical protein JHK82_047868 [Glycine max]|nr:hypothetical protein JHK82_047868 [Glycine max]
MAVVSSSSVSNNEVETEDGYFLSLQRLLKGRFVITTRIITKYDYGDLGQNIQHHGQAAPLLYDMTRIPDEFPIFLSYGGLDRLSEVTSEHVLLNHLQNHDPNKVVKSEDLGLIHRWIVMKFKHQVHNSIPNILTVGNYEMMSKLKYDPRLGQIISGLFARRLLATRMVFMITVSFNNQSYHRLLSSKDAHNNSNSDRDAQSPLEWRAHPYNQQLSSTDDAKDTEASMGLA